MEFGEMKRNTSNWSNFCILLRVWQRQLGPLVSIVASIVRGCRGGLLQFSRVESVKIFCFILRGWRLSSKTWIQSPLPEWSSWHGPESSTLETDVCVWCYALLVVHARKQEEEEIPSVHCVRKQIPTYIFCLYFYINV